MESDIVIMCLYNQEKKGCTWNQQGRYMELESMLTRLILVQIDTPVQPARRHDARTAFPTDSAGPRLHRRSLNHLMQQCQTKVPLQTDKKSQHGVETMLLPGARKRYKKGRREEEPACVVGRQR